MPPAKRKQNAKKQKSKVIITKMIFATIVFLLLNDWIVFAKQNSVKIKNKNPNTSNCQTSI